MSERGNDTPEPPVTEPSSTTASLEKWAGGSGAADMLLLWTSGRKAAVADTANNIHTTGWVCAE